MSNCTDLQSYSQPGVSTCPWCQTCPVSSSVVWWTCQTCQICTSQRSQMVSHWQRSLILPANHFLTVHQTWQVIPHFDQTNWIQYQTCLTTWYQPDLCFVEVSLVLIIQLDAGIQLLPDNSHWLWPNSLNSVVSDVSFTCCDHLVGNLKQDQLDICWN